MKIYYELDLKNFDAWSGAKDTLRTLNYDQIEQLENMLPDILGEEVSDTTLNDFLWFETDSIAEYLGFRNWAHLERANDGETDQTYVAEIKITKKKFNRINRLLAEIDFDDDSDEMEELIDELGAIEDAWEYGFSFKFEDEMEILIDIRSGNSNYYVDATYDYDAESCTLDCDEFAEEIEFEIYDNTYTCKFIIVEE